METIFQGNIVDIEARTIYFGEMQVADNRIVLIKKLADDINTAAPFICPGFIDAHVHIESSLLVPSEFARLAVAHGTIATISDPHEIANVCGEEGVYFMIENGNQVPFKFHFGAPSCVPATAFETAGASLDATAVAALLQRDDIYYLSEMMNFPGVLNGDPEVLAKIDAAHALGKPVDGHAPGLRGANAAAYFNAGISTDHECFTFDEAAGKLELGMKILIREGSAAKNFNALIDHLRTYPKQIMFCSDDKHPDSLMEGHINTLCARAVSLEVDVFDVLRAACLNPAEHYGMRTGRLRVGDAADFVILEDLVRFNVLETWIDGNAVFRDGRTEILSVNVVPINRFNTREIKAHELAVSTAEPLMPGIEAYDGQLITGTVAITPADLLVSGDGFISNPDTDLLKMVVVNRYYTAPIAVAFVRAFGMKAGAIASSVAHDSHNVIAVGVTDQAIVEAVNLVMQEQGGLSCVGYEQSMVLPLPVAGLMSADDGFEVAAAYTQLDKMAKSLGSGLAAPFMTLSFMALLVIPELKLSDLGLFDGKHFRFL